MHRFYCPHADFTQKTISISDSHEIHHIKDVLRLKKGAEVEVFNGRDQEALTMIESVGDGAVKLGIISVKSMDKQDRGRIILVCAVPKKSKFEDIIEKCTELGVDEIIPLKTKRTEVVYSSDKNPGKQERFQKVALNAAKQSGRTNIPKVHLMTAFGDALKGLSTDGIALIPSLNGHPKHIREVFEKNKGAKLVSIFIGPEGDFTPDEVEAAVKVGCIPVSLGYTVLKVDTAAITTVALSSFFLYN